MPNEIIASLISSIIGGLLVAVANYLFTHKKTEAEVEKLKAEAEKTRAETEKTRSEISKLSTTVQEVSTRFPPTEERTIYDSKDGIIGYDFEIEGDHIFKDGALILEQPGKFFVRLRKYVADGNETSFLPRRKHISMEERRLRVSCEAKVSRGSFTFALLFIEHGESNSLVGRLATVDDSKWTRVEWFFEVPSDIDLVLLIADPVPLMEFLKAENTEHENSLGNSSLFVRDLVLTEHSVKLPKTG